MLAARLVTGTPPGGRCCREIAMRLATTRGTNALLERKGARDGALHHPRLRRPAAHRHAAAPRPLRAAHRKPEPLYDEVVEVAERLAADGAVLAPLDLEALRAEAERACSRAGIEAAAVALLHAYRNPRARGGAGGLAARAGFRHVSLSSRPRAADQAPAAGGDGGGRRLPLAGDRRATWSASPARAARAARSTS